MLNSKITELAHTQIRLAFEESDATLKKDHMGIVSQFSKRGALQSGMALQSVAARYENEIKVRGEQALGILLRVVHHVGLGSTDNPKADIVEFLEPLLRDESAKIWSSMKQMAPFKSAEMSGIGKMVRLEEPYQRAVENTITKLKSEAELYAAKQARIKEHAGN